MPGLPVAAPAWFLLCMALALAGTWLALGYARRRGLFDQPGERRSHAVLTPRGGGISIALVLLVAALSGAWCFPDLRLVLLAGALGLVLVATAGWIDDHRPLSAGVRLAVHALSAASLAAAVAASGHGPLATLIALVAVLVLVNVWNFMDGIDGLAASQAAIAALGYAVLAGGGAATWIALALAGACCGFLPFNVPRARIFLGDVGSGALGHGLALAGVLVMTGPEHVPGRAAWPLLALPLAAFLVDASLTLARRVLRGEVWWQAHVQHAYQVWSRRLGRHVPVTLAYAGWSAVGTALMFGMTAAGATFIMATLATGGWCLAAVLGWVALQKTSPDGKRQAQGK